VYNLKKANIRGEDSRGMLLTSEKDSKVKLLDPQGANVGSIVHAQGLRPYPKNDLDKKKDFDKLKFKVINHQVLINNLPLVCEEHFVFAHSDDGAVVR